MSPSSDLMRTSEVAEELGVPPQTVTRWAKQGKLPYSTTLGGTVGSGHRRFLRATVEYLRDELLREARERQMLRTGDVATLFRVTNQTVARWADTGRLPVVYTSGGHRRFPEAPIREQAAQFTESQGGKP